MKEISTCKVTSSKNTLLKLSAKYDCEKLCNHVLKDAKFKLWSGSAHPNIHHYGKGGLIIHTADVANLAESIAENCTHSINMGVLITACIFHDYGKLEDYVFTDAKMLNWESTDHKYKIHHISRSVIFFADAANKENKSKAFTDAVIHCILSHHGFREWGSPVSPQTREAIILHEADNLSARLDDVYNPKPEFTKRK